MPTTERVLDWFIGASAAGCVLCACTTYILSPADEQSVRANMAIDARMLRDQPDGSMGQALMHASVCNDERVLDRSGRLGDAAPVPCGESR